MSSSPSPRNEDAATVAVRGERYGSGPLHGGEVPTDGSRTGRSGCYGRGVLSDTELYVLGARTAVACWEQMARGCVGAAIVRAPGLAAAVFPVGPERAIYNNAILSSASLVEDMERVYVDAGVADFRAWVWERDPNTIAGLLERGYALAEANRAMGMDLADLDVPRPAIEPAPITDWDEYLSTFELPSGLLTSVDREPFMVNVLREDGVPVASTLAFDHGGDCGIFNVVTTPAARRHGLGTALTAWSLHAARDRGCVTATLQSTAIAERIYARVGFRDVGLILEHAPPSGPR